MEKETSGSSLGVKALALIVLLVAAWILLKVVIGLIAGIAWFVVIVLAIVAVVWAWRTLSSS
jgi:hypothetical protein